MNKISSDFNQMTLEQRINFVKNETNNQTTEPGYAGLLMYPDDNMVIAYKVNTTSEIIDAKALSDQERDKLMNNIEAAIFKINGQSN
ncbi:hypothetical protein MD537_14770 [Flavihumibacter sediminis]|nr:hypothetical protein [Flavihumibacter sediminis]